MPDPTTKPAATRPDAGDPMMGMSGGMRDDDVPGVDPRNAADDAANRRNPPAQPAKKTPRLSVTSRTVGNITVGQPAPEISAMRVFGGTGPLRLDTLKSRPSLVVFGSYSSPTFREKASELERLRTKFASLANVWLIYTKEAYPSPGWDIDRNREAKVRVEPHATMQARKAAAEAARKELKLTVPMAVDDMTDATALAYGLVPNGSVLIDRNGVVAAAQQFFDGYAAERLLDALVKDGGIAIKPSPATRPAP